MLTPTEVSSLLAQLDGTPYLMASLLYGAGLRLLECAKLRIKDIDLERREIRVRDGKGRKDRLAPLPIALIAKLELHLHRVRQQHQADLRVGAGYVEIPDALRSKYPNAPREWPWQWLFPATRGYLHPQTGERRRHHLHETVVQRAVRQAALAAVSCHTLRHLPRLPSGELALSLASMRASLRRCLPPHRLLRCRVRVPLVARPRSLRAHLTRVSNKPLQLTAARRCHLRRRACRPW